MDLESTKFEIETIVEFILYHSELKQSTKTWRLANEVVLTVSQSFLDLWPIVLISRLTLVVLLSSADLIISVPCLLTV
jgi:hypothetical protein